MTGKYTELEVTALPSLHFSVTVSYPRPYEHPHPHPFIFLRITVYFCNLPLLSPLCDVADHGYRNTIISCHPILSDKTFGDVGDRVGSSQTAANAISCVSVVLHQLWDLLLNVDITNLEARPTARRRRRWQALHAFFNSKSASLVPLDEGGHFVWAMIRSHARSASQSRICRCRERLGSRWL